MKNFSALQLDAIDVHAPEPPASRSVEHRLGANPAPAFTPSRCSALLPPITPRAKTVREILVPTTPAAPAGRRFSISTAALLLLAVLVWFLGTGCATENWSTEKLAAKLHLDPKQLPNPFADNPSPDRTALADSRSMLNSPSRFGRYAAPATFASLPDR